MITSLRVLLLLLLSSSTAAQFTCTLNNKDPGTCDASKSSDGSNCVWCSWSSLGFCVSDAQAMEMKQVFKSLKCDNDSDGGTDDDNVAPDDDSVPDDNGIWTCLKKKDDKSCDSASCVWCDTKAGYGMCLTEEAATLAKDSYWFHCGDDDDELFKERQQQKQQSKKEQQQLETETIEDPFDTTCLLATVDQSTCVSTDDADGNKCEWCEIPAAGSIDLCLSTEQAQIAALVGSSCQQGDKVETAAGAVEAHITEDETKSEVQDPLDTSCLMAQVAGGNDEQSCVSALDSDGNACEWCAISNGLNFCLSPEQAEIAALVGGTCGSDNVGAGAAFIGLQDPLDTACLVAQFVGGNDESACVSASGSDGNGCEWCSLSNGVTFCLNSEQAQIAEMVGSSCKDGNDAGVSAGVTAAYIKDPEAEDPLDTTCLMAQLTGGNDEQSCISAADADGNACDWCTIGNGLNFCLNSEQAQIAELVGGTCGSTHDGPGASFMNVQDPLDTACLMAQLVSGNDKSACVSAADSDGNSCEWCSLSNGLNFCLNAEQAQIAELVGSSCEVSESIDEKDDASSAGKSAAYLKTDPTTDVEDPLDTACLMAQVTGGQNEAACISTYDHNGDACEWCAISDGLNFCLNPEQAQVAGLVGGTCDHSGDMMKEDNLQDPFDTACLMASIMGNDDGKSCLTYQDSDGNSCEFCTFGGSLQLCLTQEQAEIAAVAGGACDSVSTITTDHTAIKI